LCLRGSLVSKIWLWLLESDCNLVHLEVFGVPSSGEVITVVDEAVTAVNSNGGSALHVLGLVVVFLTERHTGAVGEDGCLGESLSLQKHGESVATTVLNRDFLNFDGVVG
jgi:hypothetical protein